MVNDSIIPCPLFPFVPVMFPWFFDEREHEKSSILYLLFILFIYKIYSVPVVPVKFIRYT